MEIDFFIGFFKRRNSTKRPVAGGIVTSYTIRGYLKEPCSVLNPVINIKEIPVENAPCVFTYAWIPAFYRYYFVKDWVWNDGLWTVYLNVDVLATYRPHIGETTAYIERCAAESNGRIIDKLYPAKDDFTITETRLSGCPWINWDIVDGCYVLGIISKTNLNSPGGAVQYYALTQSQITALLQYMLNDQFYNDAGFQNNAQVNHDLAKCLVNPIQYITSCMWFPTTPSTFTASGDISIEVGPWTTIGTGKPIISRVGYRSSFEVTLPVHPDASTRGEFLNYPPYTSYLCMLPPFGCFPLDPTYMQDDRKVKFTIQVDGITGKACLQVCREDTTQGTTDFFYLTSAMFGVPIQLAQVTSDFIRSATSLVSAVGSGVGAIAQGFMGNAVGAVHGGLMALGSVGNALEAAMPQAISEGVNGSFLAFERLTGTYPSIVTKCTKIVDEDNTELGRPLCEVRRIDTLSGYIRCGEATVDYTAFDDELNMIHDHLLSGFFWE